MRWPYSSSAERKGVAIIAVTMVLVVAAVLGAAIITQTSQDVQLADRAYIEKEQLYLAESGKEECYRAIWNNNYFTTVDNPSAVTTENLGNGTYTYQATTLQPTSPPNAKADIVEIVGIGDIGGGKKKQVTAVAELLWENVNIWNNAIFGGAGETGGVINGNCSIHGSVHLLGEGVGEGNASIEALDLTGNALMHNNYGPLDTLEGIPSDLQAKIPTVPGSPQDLDAKLRVKNGAVGVSGNSEIGDPAPPDGYKGPLDGIYIETDPSATRWTGTEVDANGVPSPDHVASDNGVNALYNLGDIVQMPYVDYAYGGTTFEQYYSTYSIHLPNITFDESNSSITAVQTATYTHGETVTVTGSKFTVSNIVTLPTGATQTNSLTYDTATQRMTISGMVQVDGNLVIGSQTGRRTPQVSYSGSGTMFVSGGSYAGDVYVHCNLLPVTQFPDPDVLGIMARNTMNLATGSGDAQIDMAGAFYAQTAVYSAKQNNIAGTFVSKYFDMGTNVPSIFQVPELIHHLPPGLIGSEDIWIITGFNEKSWRADIVD